jgi:pseudouridine-5'-phosphate glycosidase
MTSVQLSPEVSQALEEGRPVVALESTIIAHGLPRPDNAAAAAEFESLVRERGVTPATIAIIDGVPRAGLDAEAIDRIANDDATLKASVRDIPHVIASRATGATTVASTAYLAAQAGIRVFATGGLGGVHRGAQESFDESADLTVLASSPVAVVSAGVKSVLDIGATLERLETLSVPVVGYGTDVFPSFWLPKSEFPLDWSADTPAEVAALMAATWEMGLRSGILVANPVPEDKAWNREDHDRIIQMAFDAAERDGIRGKEVTPYLLDFIQRESSGESLRVNLDVVRNNIRVACDIATAWAGH